MKSPQDEAGDEKASDTVKVRMGAVLKKQLQDALKEHPHYQGNLSEFINDCARAYVLQCRQRREPAFPIEFIAK